MKKNIIVIFTLSLLFSCENKSETIQITTEHNTQTPEKTPLEQLELEASRLRAGGSIKEVKFNDGKAEIFYVKNYEEYKKLQPQSSLTEDDLKAYWETGSAIEKALIDGSGRIMKNLDFVNEVRIELPYGGKVYSIDLKKEDLEKITDKSFEELKGNWSIFVDGFVYSTTGREKFFDMFGSVN